MKKFLIVNILLLAIMAALFLVVSPGNAIRYSINTNDGSVSEWATQGIGLFQTDAITDTARADEDIWNTWVASTNDNKLAFLVQMAAGPALDGDSYRTIVASLDCQPNGIDLEGAPDKIVYYFWESDKVAVANGNSSFGQVIDGSEPMGQRVNDYLEWAIGFNKIADCLSTINIRFYSATSSDAVFVGTILDNSGELKGWNVPNVIKIENAQAQQRYWFNFVFYFLLGTVCLGGAIYFIKKK